MQLLATNRQKQYDATNQLSGAKPDFRGPIGYKNKIQAKRNKVLDYAYNVDYFTYQFRCEDDQLSDYKYVCTDNAEDTRNIATLAALSNQHENHMNNIRCEPINFNANRFQACQSSQSYHLLCHCLLLVSF